MKDVLKCPKCKSDYVKNRGDLTQHCSNADCVLFFHEHSTGINWKRIYRIIRYPSLKDSYFFIKNRFFKRYDLIRTGVAKSQWCDKDYLMLEGMMGLLVDYIEWERPYEMLITEYDENSEGDDFNDDQIKAYQQLLTLYIDWKVTYRKLLQDEEVSLNEWSKSSEMCFTTVNGSITNKLEFKATSGYTEEDRKRLSDVHNKCEIKVHDYEQELLHRLIDLRPLMWV